MAQNSATTTSVSSQSLENENPISPTTQQLLDTLHTHMLHMMATLQEINAGFHDETDEQKRIRAYNFGPDTGGDILPLPLADGTPFPSSVFFPKTKDALVKLTDDQVMAILDQYHVGHRHTAPRTREKHAVLAGYLGPQQ